MFVSAFFFYQAVFLIFDGPDVDVDFLNAFVSADAKDFFLLYFPFNYVLFPSAKRRYCVFMRKSPIASVKIHLAWSGADILNFMAGKKVQNGWSIVIFSTCSPSMPFLRRTSTISLRFIWVSFS